MSITKKSVTTKPLTKGLAIEFAGMEPMPGERDVNPSRMNHLRAVLDEGLFHGVDWHYASDLKTGRRYRIDGQHSSKMLADSMLPAEKVPNVLATVTEWETDSLDDDAYFLFEQFNCNWSSRTPADVMGVGISGFPDLAGVVPKPFLVSVAQGFSNWIKKRNEQAHAGYERRRKKAKDASAPTAEKTPKTRELSIYFRDGERRRFALWAYGMTKTPMGQDVKHVYLFRQAGVIAEMYDSWKKNQESTTLFWTWVLNTSHPDPDDPTRVLADALLERKSASKHVRQTKYRELVRKYYRRFTASSPATTPVFGETTTQAGDSTGVQPAA